MIKLVQQLIKNQKYIDEYREQAANNDREKDLTPKFDNSQKEINETMAEIKANYQKLPIFAYQLRK